MQQATFSELRNHAKQYFDVVESGESVRIVRNGKGHGTFMHSTVLVEFADGAQFVVARTALSRIPNR